MSDYNEVRSLIEKYFNGETSLEEEKQLQVFFQREDVPVELESFRDQFQVTEIMKDHSSTMSEDDLFAKLDEKVEKETLVVSMKSAPQMSSWIYRIAAAVALVLVGFWVGGQFSIDQNVDELRAELDALKYQLESSSASGRLQAVSNVKDGSSKDKEMIMTLSAVMKNDPNMHVRTKAVEALVQLASNKQLIEILPGALLEEQEPAVQIAMIEGLVSLQSKQAIEPLENFTKEGQALQEVRDEAHMGIFKLREL